MMLFLKSSNSFLLLLVVDLLTPHPLLALRLSFGAKNHPDGLVSKTIQVCQNKDCCKRWPMAYQKLPETVQDMLPPDAANQVRVETTGCLSHCGKGPNLCFKTQQQRGSKGGEVHVNGIVGPMSLADELEAHLGISVPSKLVAAVTVMEKAHQAPSLAEKDRFYSSIIQVLSTDPVLLHSCARARAHSYRAQTFLQVGRVDEALEDARAALQICSHGSASASLSFPSVAATAWRTMADCYSSQGRKDMAVEALKQWGHVDPLCRTKATREIERLLETETTTTSSPPNS